MLTDTQKNTMMRTVAKDAGIETDLIDVQEIDSSLSYGEAKAELLGKFMRLNSNIDMIQIEKTEIDYQKEVLKLEAEVTANHKKDIEAIKKSTTPQIDKYFWAMRALIKTVVKSDELHSLILIGASALGKSFNTINALVTMGYTPDEDFVVVSSYITPLELYTLLHNNAEKIIIFDDLFKLFSNDISKGILMSALWAVTPHRIVQYTSSTSKLDIPKKFEFKGNILFLTNFFPKDFDALKTRCLWYEIKLSFADRVKICYEMCKKRKIPLHIMEWIEEEFDESYDLNLRTPIKVFNIFKHNPDNWKEIAKTQFVGDEELAIVKELLDKAVPVAEKILEYKRETGRSRRSYYRMVKKLRELRK